MLGKLRTLYKALYLKRLVKHGLTLGSNFQMEKGCNIDAIVADKNVTISANRVLTGSPEYPLYLGKKATI